MSTLFGLDGNISSVTEQRATYENPLFVDAIKQINPMVYRTPGSAACAIDKNTGEGFQWRSDKPTLDEVKLMYDAVKPKMIYVLNMLTKRPVNQLKMLQYAASLGMSIDFIEMGNEFNVKDSPGNVKYPSGVDYSKAVLEWRTLIEQDFPDAVFICVGENKGGQKDPRHTWNDDLLKLNPDALLAFHWHSQYNYCINGITNIDLIKDAIEEAYQEAFGDIPTSKVAITEFNVGQGLHEDRADPKFADDNEQILAVTTMLQKFKDMNFPLGCYHNVIGSLGYGAIYSDSNQTFLRPAGDAIKKYLATV